MGEGGIPGKDRVSDPGAGDIAAVQGALTAVSPLFAAFDPFEQHMRLRGLSEHTVQSFLGDLSILARWSGPSTPLRAITSARVADFMGWLHKDPRRQAPKSFSRRLTTLKVFFAWLVEIGTLEVDPAEPVPHQPVSSPLPVVLRDAQVDLLLQTAQQLRAAEDPDPRPYFLVRLLLDSGIKKGECMALDVKDMDTSGAGGPVLSIRHANPRSQPKNRLLRLSPDAGAALRAYLAHYKPRGKLFPWTSRNLEYELTHLAARAGIGNVSFETLRWTSALRDWKSGMEPDALRQKMGLSEISWVDTMSRLKTLAEALQ